MFSRDGLSSSKWSAINEGPASLAKHLQRSLMELAMISNFDHSATDPPSTSLSEFESESQDPYAIKNGSREVKLMQLVYRCDGV